MASHRGARALLAVLALAAAARARPEDLRGSPFEQLHSPTEDPDGGALVLGALPVEGEGGFLGRWEGYDLGLPVPRDWKFVLVVQRVQGRRATVVVWAGTSLQRPRLLARVPADVRGGPVPELAFRARLEGTERTFTLRWVAADRLQGRLGHAFAGAPAVEETLQLTRARRLLVHRDYPAYLARKRITAQAFQDPALARFGQGYLVYLPPGYQEHPERRWPLVLFLCGSGDRGMPLEELAKASPFLFVREQGDLPAVIVAPALFDAPGYRSFPTEYMAGVLDEALARYRIDGRRVYATGLSMGGEAALRLALLRPDRLAAAAVLSMGDPRWDENLRLTGYTVTDVPYAAAAGVPFLFVNGGRDPWVRPEGVARTVEAMRAAGVAVAWRVLPENGHDVWTDTYGDRRFYEWLLAQGRAEGAD